MILWLGVRRSVTEGTQAVEANSKVSLPYALLKMTSYHLNNGHQPTIDQYPDFQSVTPTTFPNLSLNFIFNL